MHQTEIDRRSGISAWRQIADELRSDISNGNLGPQDRLPPEITLAQRFGVNRHTVRAAINSLSEEGIVESRQGQGTFVLRRARIAYPIGSRTRFTQGLSEQAKATESQLISQEAIKASDEVASALALQPGAKIICLETLSSADGIPISRATSWFCAKRFGKIASIYAKEKSITRSLNKFGVADYFRQWTNIEARHANRIDAGDLKLSPGSIVLITKYVNCDADGKPIQFSISRFAADRVSFTVESDVPDFRQPGSL